MEASNCSKKQKLNAFARLNAPRHLVHSTVRGRDKEKRRRKNNNEMDLLNKAMAAENKH